MLCDYGSVAAGPNNTPWEASGVVVRITSSEEIALELHTGKNDVVPSTETLGFAAELTWNSTAYDRMQQGLKTFAENSECMSDLLYHQILGHAPEMPRLQHRRPAAFQAPNMPVPNHSQVAALEAALAQPFTLIQGPPGTGKTITSTTLVWLLHQVAGGKVLMAAPSNVAVDHLAEKISSTGLKVQNFPPDPRFSLIVLFLCTHCWPQCTPLLFYGSALPWLCATRFQLYAEQWVPGTSLCATAALDVAHLCGSTAVRVISHC